MRVNPSFAAAVLVAACRPESRAGPAPRVDPPVDSVDAIPDAPVNGTIHGAPFTVRDARYVVDRRVGYAHTDLVLSSARAESPCGPLSSARAPSVWLRLEGAVAVEPKDWRIGAPDEGPWSVHYQAFDGDDWVGVGRGAALLSIRSATGDGHLEGGLAVCFADRGKSCVSGSFAAESCPTTLDQPVRGALAPEAVPAGYPQLTPGARGDGGR